MVVRARSEKRTGWYQTPSVAIYLFCLLFFFLHGMHVCWVDEDFYLFCFGVMVLFCFCLLFVV